MFYCRLEFLQAGTNAVIFAADENAIRQPNCCNVLLAAVIILHNPRFQHRQDFWLSAFFRWPAHISYRKCQVLV